MTDRLFEEWRAYQKLLENDYMDHKAFFARLQREIQARFQRPLAILDLGCGDAQPALPMLETLDVRRYVGVDESATALARAGESLAAAGITAEWVNGDLVETLDTIEGPFDVILASFALHHIPGAVTKQALFRACRARLSDDGLLAVIDVFHEPGEPRDEYIERWIAFADRHYEALTAREKSLLFEHVRARDYPDSLPTYRRIAAAGGLERFDVLLADAARLNHLVVMSPR